MTDSLPSNPTYVLTVGGCNIEHLLSLNTRLKIGEKNRVTAQWLVGGGAINQSLRLLHYGSIIPIPIVPLGKDELGIRIQTTLLDAYSQVNAPQFILDYLSSDALFTPNLPTRSSTLIIDEGERTILTESPPHESAFFSHLCQKIETLYPHIQTQLKAISIGDILADGLGQTSNKSGQCTEYLLNYFHSNCLILGNFGQAQLELDSSFWQQNLSKVTILQLNIKEAYQLVKKLRPNAVKSILSLIDELSTYGINFIITCDHYGVIGYYTKEPNHLIFAPPIKLEKTIDVTGAGDGFAAGLLSHLSPNFDLHNLKESINEGRIWAAYACTQIGGAANCPTAAEIETFKQVYLPKSEPVSIISRQSIQPILGLLERIYQF